MRKKALIIGANSMDASYLAELLLEKEYEVHGIIRRNSVPENQRFRINHLKDKMVLHYGDITDQTSLLNVLLTVDIFI